MEKLKTAVCIPTYNNCAILSEFLEKQLKYYKKNGVDVYIYDSSDNDATRKLVDHYKGNVTYKKLSPKIHSNKKVFQIFQEPQFQKYDFLWIMGDAIRLKKSVINEVFSKISLKYDMIIVDFMDNERIGEKVYTDKNLFFLDCAWYLTLYGACMLNVKRMLQKVSWKTMENQYLDESCINYSHIGFYFDKIFTLTNFRALHLSYIGQGRSSVLKKAPGWRNDTFLIICNRWPAAIDRLPDYYQKKTEVIKKGGVLSGILNERNLYLLRRDHIYNCKVFFQYIRKWKLLTDISIIKLLLVAIVPYKFILFKRKLEIFEMGRFCKKYNKIYIYGAGISAKRYKNYLDKMNIKCNGFLVSDLSKNSKQVQNTPVVFYKDIIQEESVGVIVAMNPQNAQEAICALAESGIVNNVFSKFIQPNYEI